MKRNNLKSLDEIKPIISKLYKEELGKNPDDLIFFKADVTEYTIQKGKNKITILRKYIDDFIDKIPDKEPGGGKGMARASILEALKKLDRPHELG